LGTKVVTDVHFRIFFVFLTIFFTDSAFLIPPFFLISSIFLVSFPMIIY